ncbi:MAG: metallophosphatase family protein [Zoogloeaceae bacterium]|jgi:putative phosphoesterase|nr:metallophosphatase family protein [Zoogloeaceae bacterium]
MKICIVSDSHDRGPMLAAAAGEAKALGAGAVLHCGDIIGPSTLKPLLELGLPIHVIHGNNFGDFTSISRMATESNGLLRYHGGDASIELAGKKIFLVHYPHYGRAVACTGDYDLVCYGHSHQPEVARQANIMGGATWLVNPGTVAGLGAPAATWILGDLANLTFEVRPVRMAAA